MTGALCIMTNFHYESHVVVIENIPSECYLTASDLFSHLNLPNLTVH